MTIKNKFLSLRQPCLAVSELVRGGNEQLEKYKEALSAGWGKKNFSQKLSSSYVEV